MGWPMWECMKLFSHSPYIEAKFWSLFFVSYNENHDLKYSVSRSHMRSFVKNNHHSYLTMRFVDKLISVKTSVYPSFPRAGTQMDTLRSSSYQATVWMCWDVYEISLWSHHIVLATDDSLPKRHRSFLWMEWYWRDCTRLPQAEAEVWRTLNLLIIR